MIADRLLALLRERLGFVPTKWSIVRIAAFAVAGLVIASLVVPARPGDVAAAPYNSELATRNTRNVALPLGDTRGFKPTSRPGTFQIAWIGGSETMAVGPKTSAFIPQLVTDEIKTVDGQSVSTDIYYLNAIRLADELAALSAALESKPDLVVVSLNPVWVLNDLAVQQWGYLDGTLARHSAWPMSRWPVAVSLVSPGDAGWMVLSRMSPSAVGDRYERGVDLADRTVDLTFLHAAGNAPPPRTLTGLEELERRRPVDFWFSHFDASNKGTTLTAKQLGILEREVSSRSSFNRKVLQEMFEMVRRAGVDAYFYMPPVDPTVYAEPDAQKYIAKVREMLASATNGHTSDRLVFDPQGLQDRVPPMKFRDIVHVLNGQREADVLSTDLCALLVAGGKEPGCEKP
jgi:hypothetical protein